MMNCFTRLRRWYVCAIVLTPVLAFSGVSISAAQPASESCEINAAGVVAEMRHSDFGPLSQREIDIVRAAALASCESTFTDLQTSLESSNATQAETGIRAEDDPIGWLKEQWNKPPVEKDGLERLKRRGRY